MPQSSQPILLVEEDEKATQTFCVLLLQITTAYPVIRVPDHANAYAYLLACPPYQDRFMYPYPAMLVLPPARQNSGGTSLLASLKERPELPPLFVALLTDGYRSPTGSPPIEVFGSLTVCTCFFESPGTYEMLSSLMTLFALWRLRHPAGLMP